jgi:hypothetical protein
MASDAKIAANRRNRAKRGTITAAGRARLREAALRNRPWERATGPTSDAGKARSSLNALRHGRETAVIRQWRRDASRFLRLHARLRWALDAGVAAEEAARLVVELVEAVQTFRAEDPMWRPYSLMSYTCE